MNIFLPVTLELFQYALAYIPNLCSDEGEICNDGSVSMRMGNFFDSVTDTVSVLIKNFYEYGLVYLNMIPGLDFFWEEPIPEETTWYGSIYSYILQFLGYPEVAKVDPQNYSVLKHIIACYCIYVLLAAKAFIQGKREKSKVQQSCEHGDASDCSSLVYEYDMEKHCYCKQGYEYDDSC